MGEGDSSDPSLTKTKSLRLLILIIFWSLFSGNKISLPLGQVGMVQKLPAEESLLSQLVHSLRRTISRHGHDPGGDQPYVSQHVKYLSQIQLSVHRQVLIERKVLEYKRLNSEIEENF